MLIPLRNMPALLAMLSGVGLVLLCACAPKTEEFKSPGLEQPVKLFEVESIDSLGKRTFSGVSDLNDDYRLSFRVDGQLRGLYINEGQAVKKGQLIAQLDPVDYELKVKQIQAEVALSKGMLQKNKADFERSLVLYESENVSKSKLDNDQSAYLASKASVAANLKSLELAKQQVAYTRLYAPASGVIVSKDVKDFETVAAGSLIATMASPTSYKVKLGVPEAIINQLEYGDLVQVNYESFPGKTYEALITEIVIKPGESTTYPVTVQLSHPDPHIRPGMVADVTFTLKGLETPYHLIPNTALMGDSNEQKYVWVYNDTTKTVSKRIVTVGQLVQNQMQITSGLTAGDLVVAHGANLMSDGLAVKILR